MYPLAVSDNCSGTQAYAFSLSQAPQGMAIDPVTGRITWTPSAGKVGMHPVRVRVVANSAMLCPPVTQSFTIEVVELPADPGSVAPPVDETVPTSLCDAVSFLFDGRSGIQTGVNPKDIEPTRVAVLRGLVQESGTLQSISGVRVSVLDHPEFGETLTRADGEFDLVVNGGSSLVLCFEHGGYLESQRRIDAVPQDYLPVETVMLVPLDAVVTELTLSSIEGCAVAQGCSITDADGTRQATVLFPEGTTASLTMPGGSGTPINTINVRATEFTVGPDGPDSMPGNLPPTSGYTYAVELSVDEAMQAGAVSIEFSQALPFYVENFVGFDVGTIVPAGYYDRELGLWVPSANGLVIGVLSISTSDVTRILGGVPGVKNIRRRRRFVGSSDVHVRFTYSGREFLVWEPYGDSSRLWIGPESTEERPSDLDIGPLQAAFSEFRPVWWRRWVAKLGFH